MRKFKEVKRKEIIFDTSEWAQIEKAAAEISMQTSEYIRRMALNGKVVHLEMAGIIPVINAMKIIGSNINQIAKKANEINSIYADDIEKLRKENSEFCRTMNGKIKSAARRGRKKYELQLTGCWVLSKILTS